MKIQSLTAIVLSFLVLGLTGCALTGPGLGFGGRIETPPYKDRPVNAYYLFSEAHLSVKKGDIDKAITIMQKALQLDPESVYLKRELAGMWLRKKNTAAALELLDSILKDDPDDIETLLLAGRVNQNLKQPDQAADAYSRVLQLDPTRQNIYLVLGGIYMDQERWEEAQAVYRQLVDHFPGNYAGYFFLGRISSIQGDARAAQRYYEKTLEIEPDLVESRFELGGLYESEKKYKQAAAIYDEILKKNPNNIQARMALAHVFHRQGYIQKADTMFTRLGQLSRDDKDVVRILVQQYLDVNDYEAADIIVRGLLKGSPDNADLIYLAGVALDGLGKKTAAIAQLKRVAPESRFFSECRCPCCPALSGNGSAAAGHRFHAGNHPEGTPKSGIQALFGIIL